MKQHNVRFNPTTVRRTIALILLFVAALGGGYLTMRGDAAGKTAAVYQNGVLIRRIDLTAVEEPYEFTVPTEDGFNTILVRKGGVCVSQADCGDQTCVKQVWLTGGLTPIVCLPHRLVIQLEDTNASESLDGVAGSLH